VGLWGIFVGPKTLTMETLFTNSPISNWAKPESLSRSYKKDGSKMSREEIFATFDTSPQVVASIPPLYLPLFGEDLKDNNVYCSEAYFIDHAINRHESTTYEEYMALQEVIDHNDDIKEVYDNGKRSVVFVKQITSDKHNYAGMAVQLEVNKEGKIVWYKTFFAQKREPYKNYNSIKPSKLKSPVDATPQSSAL